jgi:NAD(P)-dependent dehydrogenase (short-subunit alcohol dehydrogenase family)
MKKNHVALVTGATGFIGKQVVVRLLTDDVLMWHVIAVVRSKRVNGRMVSSEERFARYAASLGLGADIIKRLHWVDGELDDMADVNALYKNIDGVLSGDISNSTGCVDVVINLAGCLEQDHAMMPKEQREGIRKRNESTNVAGVDALMRCIGLFGRPMRGVRILRPSQVLGQGSTSFGAMKYMEYYNKRGFLGIRQRHWAKLFFKWQNQIPIIGDPDTVIDLIQLKDVVGAILAIIHCDLESRGTDERSKKSRVGAVYHISTAYVHGKRMGLLLEESVSSKPDQEYWNLYEESKARGEHVVEQWAMQQDPPVSVEYNHLTNELAPKTRDKDVVFFKSLGCSEEIYSKIVYCKSMDELRVLAQGTRPRFLASRQIEYWKKVEPLLSHKFDSPDTRFDCSKTKSLIPRDFHPAPFNTDYYLT